MRFNRLDLNLLVALDHLLTLKSISRAAEKMHMSQSAMSNALARLRDYFDDPILVQTGRKMELTSRAEAMKDAVRDILVRIELTVTSEPEFDPSSSTREFGILVSDYTLTVLIPHLLDIAYREAPGVRFNFMQQVEFPYVAFERGEADFLIAPSIMCSPDHPSETLYVDRYVCVVWDQGKYAEALELGAYLEAGHVRMFPPGRGASYETVFLEEKNYKRRVEVRSYSFFTLAELVVSTDRIATMHEFLARKLATHLPVVIHPVPVDDTPLEQKLQWHAYRDHDPGLRWLRDHLHRAAIRMKDSI